MSALAVLFLILAWLVNLLIGWQLLRQNGRTLLRLDDLEKRLNQTEFDEGGEPTGLPLRTEAPGFGLPDLGGGTRTLAQYQGQPLLLIFFDPDCSFCQDMLPKLAALPPHSGPLPVGRGEGGRSPGEGLPLVLLLTTGGEEKNRRLFAEHNIGCPVLLQNEDEVAKAYQSHGTPSGYLISAEGKIASALALGTDALLALALGKDSQPSTLAPQPAASGNGDSRETRFSQRSLAGSKIKRDGLKAGTPAPEFKLPRLDGRGALSLSELRGRRVLLVFTSPGCGPCDTLAPQLERFHHRHPEIELVMISKGEAQENRAKVKEHGLTFSIVLQQQWEISRRYALFATPIAYLVDEAGSIAGDVAVGVDQIRALLRGMDLGVNRPEPALA